MYYILYIVYIIHFVRTYCTLLRECRINFWACFVICLSAVGYTVYCYFWKVNTILTFFLSFHPPSPLLDSISKVRVRPRSDHVLWVFSSLPLFFSPPPPHSVSFESVVCFLVVVFLPVRQIFLRQSCGKLSNN